MTNQQMSEEEAKKEHDDIQAEIARERGEKREAPKEEEAEEEKRDEGEAGDVTDPEEKDPPEADSEGVDPKDEPRDDRVPLKKFQETKKNLEGEKAELQSKVVELTEALKKATTSKGMSDKIKSFSEKHGMEEAAALDLVQLVLDEVKPSEATQKIEHFIKKQEIDEKFQSELDAFIAENPEAADRADEIRAKAFEEGNLDKSLFEVFHRFVKPTEKKKTGESSRNTRTPGKVGFDVNKVIEDAKANKPGALKGLTNEQLDQVFEEMDKTGSRYNNRG